MRKEFIWIYILLTKRKVNPFSFGKQQNSTINLKIHVDN